MFSIFKKDPLEDLQKKRKKLLEEAMHTQRSGNLRLYADNIVAIEELEKEIERLHPTASTKAG